MKPVEVVRIPDGHIDTVIQAAYMLSQPQGMGFLHYTPEPLTAAEIEDIRAGDRRGYIHMDYVKGRAVKLTIFKDDAGYMIPNDGRWYDHSPIACHELMRIAAGGNPQ